MPLVTLSPQWEQAFAEAIVGQGDEKQLAMPPSQAAGIHLERAEAFDAARHGGRNAGAADQPRRPTLCALDHRAVPRRPRW